MKRLFCEIKMYDYTTKAEAEEHKEHMRQNGWFVKDEITLEPDSNYKYSIEYGRYRG